VVSVCTEHVLVGVGDAVRGEGDGEEGHGIRGPHIAREEERDIVALRRGKACSEHFAVRDACCTFHEFVTPPDVREGQE
jgi:hypothetical protein